MEAMATGKPIIAVNALALPHLVHNGINGYTYEPGDIKTLAARLIELLIDQKKREVMGQKSLEIIAEHDIHKILATFEKLYNDEIEKQTSCRVFDPLSGPLTGPNDDP